MFICFSESPVVTIWDLWDPMCEQFVKCRKEGFANVGPPMTFPQKVPFSNVLYLTNIPPSASMDDFKKYFLPTVPLQITIHKDGTAHVEILRKRDAVIIIMSDKKRLKGARLRIFPNKLVTEGELIAQLKFPLFL